MGGDGGGGVEEHLAMAVAEKAKAEVARRRRGGVSVGGEEKMGSRCGGGVEELLAMAMAVATEVKASRRRQG